MGKIMSHGSWTYLKPRTFLGRMFHFIGKCQSHDIKEQYEQFGVRGFDLSVKPLKGGGMIIGYGKFKYTADGLEDDLKYLDEKGDAIVRVRWKVDMYRYETDEDREWFINYCKQLQETYKNIKFYGGCTTHHCYQYYNFITLPPTWIKNYTRLAWPWLFAKLRKNKFNETDDVSSDYVEYLKIENAAD